MPIAVRTRRPRRMAYACGVAAAGILLVAMAAPRLCAGVAVLSADLVLRQVLDRQPVSDLELERLAESRREALSWHAVGRTGTDLGLALLLRAERKPVLLIDRDLDPVREAIVDGLTRAPAAPHAWLRLATVERAIAGDTAKVARLVEMSILTGPGEREILFPRLLLGLAALRRDEGRLQELLLVELDWAWRADRSRTVDAVRATGTEEVLQSLLRQRRPQDVDLLERMLASQGSASAIPALPKKNHSL